MLTRQESSLSSSRRQAAAATTPPPRESHHAKAIGCMSGIFQIFSKYQYPNKRLTFGKKQEKCKQPQSPSRKAKTLEQASISSAKQDKAELKLTFDKKILSCDINVPNRSSMIPSEIRISNPASNSSESPRTPSSLVARLMGLEDMNVKNPELDEESVAEKRRRLLRALEKCNEDLESLKRIIKSVQSADFRLQPPLPAAKRLCPDGGERGRNDSWNEKVVGRKCTEVGAAAEELSPVCVLDEFTRSPVNNFTRVQNALGNQARVASQQRKPNHTAMKKPGEEDEYSILAKHILFNKSTPSSDNNINYQMRQLALSHDHQPIRISNKPMVESVEEVCVDISWGEKREVGRIGLALQDHLFRDLVEELVKEEIMINFQYKIKIPPEKSLLQQVCCDIRMLNPTVLPLEACKRRLRF